MIAGRGWGVASTRVGRSPTLVALVWLFEPGGFV